ncbi:MAG: GAF domain-containing protein [Candidatus Riflebacteria bacterium]|nr:GAF domain-containing protein [Candidatus Riflebacteria bacterium]
MQRDAADLDAVFSSRERRTIAQLIRASLGITGRFLSESEAAQVTLHGEVACGLESVEGCNRRHCVTTLKGELRDEGRLYTCAFGLGWFLLPLDSGPRRLGYFLMGPFFEDSQVREEFFDAHPEAREMRFEYPVLPSSSKSALALVRDWLGHRVRSTHLAQELAKKETLLLSLLDSTKIIHSTPNAEELLSYLTDISTYLTNATNGFILLLDDPGRFLKIVVARGVMPDFDREYRIPLGEGVTGWVAEHGEPLNIPETEKDDRYIAVGYQAASELAVPIRRSERVIGVLVVDSVDKNAFSAFDQQLLSSLAFQVSTVLDAVNLEAERQRKLEQLQVLHSVAAAAGESLEVDQVIPRVLEQAAGVFQSTGAVLLLIDEDEKVLHVKIADQPEIRKVDAAKVDGGILGWVLDNRKPLLVQPGDRETYARFREYLTSDSHATMCVPLTLGGEILGALMVASPGVGRIYDKPDLDLLGTLAGHIAQAVQNARQFSRSRRQVAELTLINELGRTLNSSLDLEEVLAYIISNISELIGAERGSLMLWDEKEQTLKVSVSKGLDERLSREVAFRMGEGIAGIVAETRQPLVISNTRHDPRYVERMKNEEALTLMTAPIINKDRVLGVLNFERAIRFRRSFRDEDLRLLSTLANHAGIAIENARLYQNLLTAYFETIRSLANALEAKDAYTHGHSRRVAKDAVRIAQKLKLPTKKIEMIRHGALLHDIGKIGIRDSILLKPGALSEEELAVIRKHPLLGANIIQSIEFLKDVTEIIRHHHERVDGRGFPYGLASDKIPLGARIVCVADAFDAMVTTRPYRKGMSYQRAIAELTRNKGSQFDPALVNAFVELLYEMHPSLADHNSEFNPRIDVSGEAGCDWIQETELGPAAALS